jgi:hypothetical protein
LLFAVVISLAVASRLPFETALAQTGLAPPATSEAKPGPKAAGTSATTVSAETVLLLIRSALLTLNDAQQTGNYTVLRDRGAASFRNRNNAAQLSRIFSSLTVRGIDLSSTAILTPNMQSTPVIGSDGRLRIQGYFPGDPVRIDFDLMFEAVGGIWHIYALSVAPVVADANASAKTPAKGPASKAKK